jgi:hypothetical protein
MLAPTVESGHRDPWNKGKLVGQKAPLKLKDIWAIRIRLELGDRKRELALFNLAIDSKLRGCDLIQLRVLDVAHGDRIAARTIVMQQKTQRPVQFEITEPTRKSVLTWIRHARLKAEDYLFPSRIRLSPHLSTRQYARIVGAWVTTLGSRSLTHWKWRNRPKCRGLEKAAACSTLVAARPPFFKLGLTSSGRDRPTADLDGHPLTGNTNHARGSHGPKERGEID